MFVGCPGFVLLLIGKCSYGNIGKGHDLETLLAEVRHLRSSHEDLQARQDVLEARVARLEELARVGTLRTCAEYAQYGLKTSGLYMVDPDGPLLGQPPFQVFCNFDAGKGVFVPRIAFDIDTNTFTRNN